MDAEGSGAPLTTAPPRSLPGRHVLEPYLSAGDQLLIVRATDLDLPELLRPTLLDGGGDHVETAPAVGAQEVCGVGDAHRHLPAVLHGLERSGRRERLDRGR